MLTRQIERAQRKVESHNFDARKNRWNTTTSRTTSAR
jgi:preprotein translocase subunit SecA